MASNLATASNLVGMVKCWCFEKQREDQLFSECLERPRVQEFSLFFMSIDRDILEEERLHFLHSWIHFSCY